MQQADEEEAGQAGAGATAAGGWQIDQPDFDEVGVAENMKAHLLADDRKKREIRTARDLLR